MRKCNTSTAHTELKEETHASSRENHKARSEQKHSAISPGQIALRLSDSTHIILKLHGFFSQYIQRQISINNPLTAFIKCVLLLICIKQNQTKNQFLSG